MDADRMVRPFDLISSSRPRYGEQRFGGVSWRRSEMRVPQIVLIFLLFAASGATAQITAATVSGSIKDATGGVLPGVDVVVRNLETGVASSAVTDASGAFTIAGLAPGRYEARATLTGLKAEVRTFELAVAQQAGLSLTLTGGTTE